MPARGPVRVRREATRHGQPGGAGETGRATLPGGGEEEEEMGKGIACSAGCGTVQVGKRVREARERSRRRQQFPRERFRRRARDGAVRRPGRGGEGRQWREGTGRRGTGRWREVQWRIQFQGAKGGGGAEGKGGGGSGRRGVISGGGARGSGGGGMSERARPGTRGGGRGEELSWDGTSPLFSSSAMCRMVENRSPSAENRSPSEGNGSACCSPLSSSRSRGSRRQLWRGLGGNEMALRWLPGGLLLQLPGEEADGDIQLSAGGEGRGLPLASGGGIHPGLSCRRCGTAEAAVTRGLSALVKRCSRSRSMPGRRGAEVEAAVVAVFPASQ